MQLHDGLPVEAGVSAARLEQVRASMRDYMARTAQQGVVVCVARKGIIVMHEANGRLTSGPDSPPLPVNALFPIASITKVLTATAVMILVEDGRLGLFLPVSSIIPEFGGEGKDAVTVFHLLTHTSGLREEDAEEHANMVRGTVAVPPAEATQQPSLAEHLALRYGTPLARKPGTEMSYSNLNFDLLGEIVRRVSGNSLEEFMRERVFRPLGMNDTHYGFAGPWASGPWAARLVGYPTDHPFAPLLASKQIREMGAPSGHGISTALDLASFGQMFLNDGRYGEARVLSHVAVAAMTRNQIPGLGVRWGGELVPGSSWGLGWSVRADKMCGQDVELMLSQRAFSHGGAGGVFLWVDPAYEVVGVYLTVEGSGAAGFTRPGLYGAGLFVNAVMAAIEHP